MAYADGNYGGQEDVHANERGHSGKSRRGRDDWRRGCL